MAVCAAVASEIEESRAMIHATLIRRIESNHGTFSTFITDADSERIWYCAEPPNRNNARDKSCIPAGRYIVVHHLSPTKGNCLKILDVPGRTAILFHIGNFAGDEELGFKSDTDGCVLPGLSLGWLDNQAVVKDSAVAFRQIKQLVPDDGMILDIIDYTQKGASSHES